MRKNSRNATTELLAIHCQKAVASVLGRLRKCQRRISHKDQEEDIRFAPVLYLRTCSAARIRIESVIQRITIPAKTEFFPSPLHTYQQPSPNNRPRWKTSTTHFPLPGQIIRRNPGQPLSRKIGHGGDLELADDR